MTRTTRITHTMAPFLAGAALLVGCTVTDAAAPTIDGGRESVAPGAPKKPRPVPLEPGEAWLLYQGPGQRGAEVRMIRPDGSGDHPVVPTLRGTDQTNPDWSPDGERVVFALRVGRTEDVWVADADGTDAHVVVACRGRCVYLDDPAWSPDGSSVAFARTADHGRRNTLEVVDLETGEGTVLIPSTPRTFYAGPRWSPDGRYLVCEAVAKVGPSLDAEVTGVSLILVDLAAGQTTPLTDPGLFAATADWSPTRNRLVYSALPEPDAPAPDLFSISPFGGDAERVTRLAEQGGYAAEPTYSPDGQTIVFSGQVSDQGAPGLLLRVSDDGGPVTVAVDRDGRHPRWRPGTASPS